jgi:hypothetical protein
MQAKFLGGIVLALLPSFAAAQNSGGDQGKRGEPPSTASGGDTSAKGSTKGDSSGNRSDANGAAAPAGANSDANATEAPASSFPRQTSSSRDVQGTGGHRQPPQTILPTNPTQGTDAGQTRL